MMSGIPEECPPGASESPPGINTRYKGTKRVSVHERASAPRKTLLTISQKLEILKELDEGASIERLCEEYQLTPSKIQYIITRRSKLVEFCLQNGGMKNLSSRVSTRGPRNSSLDAALYYWYSYRVNHGLPVSSTLLTQKAKQYHQEMNIPHNCQYSNGWLQKFKTRHGISQKDLADKPALAIMECSDWAKKKSLTMADFESTDGSCMHLKRRNDEPENFHKRMKVCQSVGVDICHCLESYSDEDMIEVKDEPLDDEIGSDDIYGYHDARIEGEDDAKLHTVRAQYPVSVASTEDLAPISNTQYQAPISNTQYQTPISNIQYLPSIANTKHLTPNVSTQNLPPIDIIKDPPHIVSTNDPSPIVSTNNPPLIMSTKDPHPIVSTNDPPHIVSTKDPPCIVNTRCRLPIDNTNCPTSNVNIIYQPFFVNISQISSKNHQPPIFRAKDPLSVVSTKELPPIANMIELALIVSTKDSPSIISDENLPPNIANTNDSAYMASTNAPTSIINTKDKFSIVSTKNPPPVSNIKDPPPVSSTKDSTSVAIKSTDLLCKHSSSCQTCRTQVAEERTTPSPTGRHKTTKPMFSSVSKFMSCEHIKTGLSNLAIVHPLKVNESTSHTVKKQQELMKDKINVSSNTKSLWGVCYPSGIEDKHKKSISLDNSMTREKATRIQATTEQDDDASSSTPCLVSTGVLNRFKMLHKLRTVTQEKRAGVDYTAALRYRTEFTRIIKDGGYLPEQVFNTDETSLFWKCLPHKTFLVKDEKAVLGFKASKDRLTLLFCSNAAGDFKLPPVLVYRSYHTRALKNVTGLPVVWRASSKAQMTSTIFADWYQHNFIPAVDKYLRLKNLPSKAILFVDNAPSHPQTLNDDSDGYRLEFFPPNTSALLQPLEQGVMSKIKRLYTKQVFWEMLLNSEGEGKGKEAVADFWKKFNIRNAISIMIDSWEKITSSCLNEAWENLWPEIISQFHGFPDTQLEVHSIVEIANSIPGEGFGDLVAKDILEHLESHRNIPTPEDILELTTEESDEGQDDGAEATSNSQMPSSAMRQFVNYMNSCLEIADNDSNFKRASEFVSHIRKASEVYVKSIHARSKNKITIDFCE